MDPSRRRLLHLALAAPLAALAGHARAAQSARELAFHNLHTGERLRVVYWEAGRYLVDAQAAISHVLRDHRADQSHAMDPRLLDLLHELQQRVGNRRAFEVISGYRAPATNEMLRLHGGGGVSRLSQHLFGKAIDVRLPGTKLPRLHAAACALKGGGVGLYGGPDFIHLDTGRVRYW